MLALCNGSPSPLGQQVQITIAANNIVIRNKVQNLNSTTENRHGLAHSGDHSAGCVDGQGLGHHGRVCSLVHGPKLCSGSVLVLCRSGTFQNILEQFHASAVSGGDRLNIGGM